MYALSCHNSDNPRFAVCFRPLQIPFADYGSGSPNSSDDYGRGSGDRGGDGEARGDGGGGSDARESADEAQRRMLVTAFSAVCSVSVSFVMRFYILCMQRFVAVDACCGRQPI